MKTEQNRWKGHINCSGLLTDRLGNLRIAGFPKLIFNIFNRHYRFLRGKISFDERANKIILSEFDPVANLLKSEVKDLADHLSEYKSAIIDFRIPIR